MSGSPSIPQNSPHFSQVLPRTAFLLLKHKGFCLQLQVMCSVATLLPLYFALLWKLCKTCS